MSWIGWIGVALVIALIVAVTGLGPKGGRRVANTQLMTVARVVLFLMLAALAYYAWR